MRTMIPFDSNWMFLKPGENRVSVTLPHTWNALDGQDGGGDYWRGECVYEKTFTAPDRKTDEEVFLEFDGVSASAKVTMNGHFVGEHHGGYSRFRFNISAYLIPGENRLTVAVSNAACDKKMINIAASWIFYGFYIAKPRRCIEQGCTA